MNMIKVLFAIACLVCAASGQISTTSRETVKIEGVVTDFYGVPWSGAKIRLKARKTYVNSGSDDRDVVSVLETTTGKDGRYEFASLTPELFYEVTILRMNEITLEETKRLGLLLPGKVSKIDFGVEVGAISECLSGISGTVKDAAGKPIKGAKVSAFSAFGQQRFLHGFSNGKGEFRIKICGLGSYVVFANTPEFEVQTTNVTFEKFNDTDKTVEFRLKPLSPARRSWRSAYLASK